MGRGWSVVSVYDAPIFLVKTVFHMTLAGFAVKTNLGAITSQSYLQGHWLIVGLFRLNNAKHRGYAEFIRAALRHMREYNVHRSIDNYRKLIDLFPKGPLIPANVWQVINPVYYFTCRMNSAF